MVPFDQGTHNGLYALYSYNLTFSSHRHCGIVFGMGGPELPVQLNLALFKFADASGYQGMHPNQAVNVGFLPAYL